jgi:hypothetical protein
MLDKLRRKSEGERRSIAFALAVLITFIIFLIWLSVLFSGDSSSAEAERERTESSFESGIESLSSLWGNFTGLFEGVGEQFEGMPPEEKLRTLENDATGTEYTDGAQDLEY